MSKILILYVDFAVDEDFDFLRHRCVDAVQGVVDGFIEEELNDGTVMVDWEVEDTEDA